MMTISKMSPFLKLQQLLQNVLLLELTRKDGTLLLGLKSVHEYHRKRKRVTSITCALNNNVVYDLLEDSQEEVPPSNLSSVNGDVAQPSHANLRNSTLGVTV